jgi:D-lactate dehydrogenase
MQFRRIENYDFRIVGLRGLELRGKTVGVVGTGKIGAEAILLLGAFGCRILAYGSVHNPKTTQFAQYTSLEQVLTQSDIILFHCPLTPENHHMIQKETIAKMKDGAMLVNTARGGLIDSQAVLDALESGKLAGYALDVYEFEKHYKRQEYRRQPFGNELLEQLLANDRVVFTTHTAFYTDEAITSIIATTLANLNDFITTGSCINEISNQ